LFLYAASFLLVVSAAVVLVLAARDLFRSLTPLWVSVALSVAAIVVAVLGVVLPRRRER
jgi:uncharacterized membrane protein (DUF2068 family)